MEKNVDPFWVHVEDMDDGSGSKQCVHCKRQKFTKKTSIWRIKCHLSGERGRGVAICNKVPKEVQEEAFQALFGARKRHKSIASSSNVNDNAMPTLPQEQNNEIDIAGGSVQTQAQGLEQRVAGDRTSFPAEAGNYMGNIGLGTEEESAEGYLLDSLPVDDMAVVDQFPEWFVHYDQVNPLLEPINEHENYPVNFISTCPQEQNRVVENLGEEIERVVQPQAQSLEQGVTEEVSSSLAEARNHMGAEEENIRGLMDSLRAEEMELNPLFSHNNVVEDLGGAVPPEAPGVEQRVEDMVLVGMEEGDVEKETGTLPQQAAGPSSSRGLLHSTSNKTTVDVFPISSTRVVGEAFEENKKDIWSSLMNDEVSSIGIYGMGGVGKMTLVKHIYGQLSSTFHHVYWITVSQDFSISRLQNLIAKRIGLNLSNKDEEWCRAAKLSKKLMKKQKWVLILDDLWNPFDLEVVGIPIQMKGCKLILTTRSERICHQMRCQEIIKVEPLSDVQAWTLFMEKLGHERALSSETEKIAKLITRECDGLPLGITTMARFMRGVVDIREWRNALKELKESKVRKDDMEPEVFRIIKFSYNHLKDSALQQCFLYCALFPEDCEISRDELIYFLIIEGIIEEMQSIVEQFDRGHTMVKKLVDICLLERCSLFPDGVKMHDLIRDMALQILQENSHVMVKAGVQLEELPDVEKWNVNLLRVSLMRNRIHKIPENHSPKCPNLSTLLLCRNFGLQFIADAFFRQFCNLKVLDLSDTNIEMLPDSVSGLVTLDALLLRDCLNLSRMPSMKKLRALRRLDLGGTKLDNVPNGMECLSNLRSLSLGAFAGKDLLVEILPNMSHLQVFMQDLLDICPDEILQVKGTEVARLRKLESLRCNFKNLSDLVEYLSFRDKTQSLNSYCLYVGDHQIHDVLEYECMNNIVALGKLPICKDGDLQVMFPNDMKELVIWECDDAASFISSSIKRAAKLERIEIRNCDAIKSLLSSSWFCSAPLEPPSSLSLKHLVCVECRSMKKLFPLLLLPSLVNLEEILVENCCNLEEIMGTADEVGKMGEECSSNCYSIAEFSLPKLTFLQLEVLPKLRSICSTKLKCDSLQKIGVQYCPKLKRMPLSLPLLDNGQPSPPPSLRKIDMDEGTWESVEWDHPNAKDVLLPLVDFWPSG